MRDYRLSLQSAAFGVVLSLAPVGVIAVKVLFPGMSSLYLMTLALLLLAMCMSEKLLSDYYWLRQCSFYMIAGAYSVAILAVLSMDVLLASLIVFHAVVMAIILSSSV